MITIKNGTNYKTSDLIEPMTKLVETGFKAKFTNRLFKEDEVSSVLHAFANYMCEMKKENLLIAEIDGEIAGCIFLTTYKEKYPKLHSMIKDSLTLKQELRLMLLLGLLSHKAKENERYIDFIAVLPEFRSHGIGKELIAECKQLYSQERITLYVAGDNFRAYDLYRKVDFKLVQADESSFVKKITGISNWFLMEYPSKKAAN